MTDDLITRAIASIAGLQWDAQIKIEHTAGFDRDRVAKLNAVGLLPSLDQLPEKLRQQEPYGQQSPESCLVQSTTFDLLGEYNSSRHKIVIFDDLIAAAAIALNVDCGVLATVVLAHELAHAVTHLAKDADAAIWQHFSIASEEDKELFAQIYPHLYFAHNDQTLHAAAMQKLCDCQPEQYSTWKLLLSETQEQINARLLAARRKTPPDFQVSWSFMGFGINMGRSGDGAGLVLSDGRAFFGMDWGLGFQLGKQCPGTVRAETIGALREAIVRSGVMNLGNTAFGPEAFMDGGTANMEIRVGNKERSFEARCGDWGRYTQQFTSITKLFAQAMREASKT